jgi:hypothetical protein
MIDFSFLLEIMVTKVINKKVHECASGKDIMSIA